MLLSEAIRNGCLRHPQAFGSMFQEKEENNKMEFKTCAVGAAYVGSSSEDDVALKNKYESNPRYSNGFNNWVAQCHQRICATFPILEEKVMPPSDVLHMCGCKQELVGLIIHLNDTAKWSREKIADWVETVEKKLLEGIQA